jgi:hypothetical protein
MKTKREQRRDAIYRLKDYFNQPRGYYRNVAHAILGDRYLDITGETCIRSIIDLLTDDDADECIKLPRDADGEVIHVGDELCGYGYPYGEVYCQAIINDETILVGGENDAYEDWLMWSSHECKHFHMAELMRLLIRMKDDLFDPYKDCDDVIAEYAKKLQIKEDDNGEE